MYTICRYLVLIKKRLLLLLLLLLLLRRETEPSRISYMKIIKLFRKTKIIRDSAKSCLKKCIPNSSKLKLMQFEYNRLHFMESRCEDERLLSQN